MQYSHPTYHFSISDIDAKLWKKPYRPDFQKIIWIQDGKGIHKIDNVKIEIKPDSFYLINKGMVYQLLENSHIKGKVIQYSNEFIPPVNDYFSDNFYSSLYGYIADVGYFQLRKQEIKQYTDLLDQLQFEYANQMNAFGKRDIIQHILLALLFRLERKSRELVSIKMGNTEKKEKYVYYQFLLLVEQNFHQHHDVEFYSQAMGIRRRKLSETVKLFTQKSAKVVIKERIILESKRLLAFSKGNLKDIAFQLGFETATYFSRVFKNHTSKTPLEYQRSILR